MSPTTRLFTLAWCILTVGLTTLSSTSIHAGEGAVTTKISAPQNGAALCWKDLPVQIKSDFGLSAFVDLYVNDVLVFEQQAIEAFGTLDLIIPKAKLKPGDNTLQVTSYYMMPNNNTKHGEYTSPATHVTIVVVKSLLPNEGEEIDDGDNNADTKTFVLRTGNGTVTVTATPDPLLAEDQLPSEWILTGGTGNGKLQRTVDSAKKGITEFTCTCGNSKKSLTLIVTELKITFTPVDDFEGRSHTRVGIGEPGKLRIISNPSIVLDDAKWDLVEGDALLTPPLMIQTLR